MELIEEKLLGFNINDDDILPQLANNTWNYEGISSSSSSAAAANFISFQNSSNNAYPDNHEFSTVCDEIMQDKSISCSEIMNFSSSEIINISTSINRSPLQAQNHVMAERKRRQNLRQLFITLSKALPGLKKLDKASILEDAIDYLKGLKERVGVLEEEEMKTDNNNKDDELGAAPEIEAIISNKQVLVKILFNKEMKMVMWKIPVEMGKIHLNVVDIRAMPFGALHHITILAQMWGEFRGNSKDIVDLLHTVLLNAV